MQFSARHITLALFAAIGVWFAAPLGFGAHGAAKSPDYYDSNARMAAKAGNYERMKAIVDSGMVYYPDITGLNELAGLYYYKKKDYDTARYYLYRSLQANDDNVLAKQLMVDVEEATNNYSSAICYVNELLEVTPYWRGLWNRKIQLYRKQGNDEEAERLLKRLRKIYPEDRDIANEYLRHIDGRFEAHKRAGNTKAMIEDIQEIIESGMAYDDHYMILANLYLGQGDTEMALGVLGEGISKYPTEALIKKKVGLLASAERFGEATALVESLQDIHGSLGFLSSLRQGLMEERARVEAYNDPYNLYAKLYAEHHSSEALEYLLSTSFARGYDADALYYIDESMRSKGRTAPLLYRKYLVHKRINDFSQARGVLEELYNLQPSNLDIAEELTRIKLDDAQQSMLAGDYDSAITSLLFINPNVPNFDPSLASAIYGRLYTCYANLKKWDEALETLETYSPSLPRETYIARRAQLLADSGRRREAMDFARLSLTDMPADADTLNMLAVIATYEELAIPYIKELIENGALNEAYHETRQLLDVNPTSKEGLGYAITTTDLLGLDHKHDEYVERARKLYPDDIPFMLKQAAIYTREKDYITALGMVTPYLQHYPGNRDLVNAYAENSELLALAQLKEHRPDSALVTVDRALYYDHYNHQLLYTKGLAFEAKHMYDSAYIYQSKYVPGPLELDEYKHHLKTLQSLHYTNVIDFQYLQGRYGEIDVITSVATVGYHRTSRRETWGLVLNYAGRDGTSSNDPDVQTPGGVGIQLVGEYSRPWKRNWTFNATAALSNRYFPQIHFTLGAEKALRNDWTVDGRLSFRRIETFAKVYKWVDSSVIGEPGAWTFDTWERNYKLLFSLGVGATKSIDNFTMEGHADLFLLQSKLYVNLALRGRYFPLGDKRTSIFAMTGIGTAPEASMLDDAMPGSFSKLNTMVGLGGSYLLFRTVGLGLLGTWHTFYSQNSRRTGTLTDYTEETIYNYRNLYNVWAQVSIYF